MGQVDLTSGNTPVWGASPSDKTGDVRDVRLGGTQEEITAKCSSLIARINVICGGFASNPGDLTPEYAKELEDCLNQLRTMYNSGQLDFFKNKNASTGDTLYSCVYNILTAFALRFGADLQKPFSFDATVLSKMKDVGLYHIDALSAVLLNVGALVAALPAPAFAPSDTPSTSDKFYQYVYDDYIATLKEIQRIVSRTSGNLSQADADSLSNNWAKLNDMCTHKLLPPELEADAKAVMEHIAAVAQNTSGFIFPETGQYIHESGSDGKTIADVLNGVINKSPPAGMISNGAVTLQVMSIISALCDATDALLTNVVKLIEKKTQELQELQKIKGKIPVFGPGDMRGIDDKDKTSMASNINTIYAAGQTKLDAMIEKAQAEIKSIESVSSGLKDFKTGLTNMFGDVIDALRNLSRKINQ